MRKPPEMRLAPMMRGLALAILLAGSGAAHAGEAAVPVAASLAERSEGARITIAHWPAGGWSVQQFENLVEIRFPGSAMEIGFDGAGHAGGGRVVEMASAVTGEGTVLRLTLGCDCAVAIMGDGVSQLSIDIVGTVPRGAAAADGPAPVMAPRPPVREVITALEDGTEVLDPQAARERLLRELERAAASGLVTLVDPDDPLRPDLGGTSGGAATEPVAEPIAEPEDVAGADHSAGGSEAHGVGAEASKTAPVGGGTDALAARHGDAVPPHPAPAHAGPAEHPATGTSAAMLEGGGMAGEPDGATPEAGGDPEGGAACLADDLLNLAMLDPQTPWISEIARLNAELLGEFDLPRGDRAVELARLYLQAGMGVEARAVLSDFAPDHPLTAPLSEIAGFVEGETPTDSMVLAASPCAGFQALWAAVGHAMRGDPDAAMAAEARAGRSLERLPSALRVFAAARLGHAAADAGNWEAARRFQAMGARSARSSEDRDAARLALLEARLAAWRGETEGQSRLLGGLVHRDDDIGLEAQIALADAMADLQRRGAAGLAADLGANALIYRGTPEGERAFLAEVMLLGTSDGIEAALDLAAQGLATGVISEDAFVGISGTLAGSGAHPGDGEALAKAYLADPSRFGGALAEPSFRNAMIRSLASAGLPTIAQRMMQGRMEDVPADVVMAVAAAELALGGAEPAIGLVSALAAVPETTMFLARAELSAGAPQEALARLAGARGAEGNVRLAADAAWRAGVWDRAVPALGALVEADPKPDHAVRLALAAYAAGSSDIPDAAREVLAAEAPDLLAGLERLFETPPAVIAAPEVSALVEDIGVEAGMLRRLLTDG